VYRKVESEPKDEVAAIERELEKNGTLCFGEFNNCAATFNVSSK